MATNKENLCRACLQQSNKVVPIFGYCNIDTSNFLISDLFSKSTNLDINSDDNLPENICETCLDDLVIAYQFQEKCENSDKILRSTDATNLIIEDVESFKPQYLIDEVDTMVESPNETINTFKCDYCDQIFPRKISKLNHERIHTANRSYKCCVCPETKHTKSGLLNHLLSHTSILRCDLCDLNFKNSRTKLLHTKRNRKCPKHVAANEEINKNRLMDRDLVLVQQQIKKIRSSSASKKKNLQSTTNHDDTNASSSKYKCTELACGRIFTSLVSFREHKKIHDPDCAVECNYCDKMFSSKSKREPHHRTHRGERPYKCCICPEARSTKSTLLKHLLCHARSLKCKPCAISFASARSYVTHMKIHNEDPNYEPNNDSDRDDDLDENQQKLKRQIDEIRSTTVSQKFNINTKCSICYREFATPSELKSHAEVHRDVGDYLCTICGKTSITKAGHREHLFLHKSSGEFQCEHCDKVCSSSCQLKVHVRKHTGEKPYLCNTCGKSFSTSTVLLVHNRVHTGEKPFKCIVDGCLAAFRTISKLNRHCTIVHSTKRPYECIVCSKKFAFFDEFKSHVVIHSTEMPYECGSCGKGFTQNSHLKVHLRVHTGEK